MFVLNDKNIQMTNKEVVGKFVIVKDLQFSDFMKNEKGEINVYETYDQAMLVCGMYEFDDVLVMEIKYNYIESIH